MSLHLKRLASPRTWSGAISRKTFTWVVRPRPGPHPSDSSIPLALVLRDYLGLARTLREARVILSSRALLVDGRVATDPKRGVGLMDVVSIPKAGIHRRVLIDQRGRLVLVPIPEEQAHWKLSRVVGRTTVRGGKYQIHFHDGRNLLTKDRVPKVGDVLKLKLPEQSVLSTIPMAEGSLALLTGGSHTGETARIVGREIKRSPKPNLVMLEGTERFSTIEPYVFVVGRTESEIVLPREV